MTSTIQKWGNSLGLRIPSHIARELGLSAGTPVRIVRRARHVLVTPARPAYSLAKLVKGITRANVHGETQTGPQRGVESW